MLGLSMKRALITRRTEEMPLVITTLGALTEDQVQLPATITDSSQPPITLALENLTPSSALLR